MNQKQEYFKVHYHYDGIPKILHSYVKNEFMRNRSRMVRVCNEHWADVNAEWRTTGEKAMLGEFFEDINPKYSILARKRIQPFLDAENKKLFSLCKYKLDENCDLVGFVPLLKNSRIWIDLEPVQ